MPVDVTRNGGRYCGYEHDTQAVNERPTWEPFGLGVQVLLRQVGIQDASIRAIRSHDCQGAHCSGDDGARQTCEVCKVSHAKTPAERQAEFRARKAAAQCPEVRGIFAHEQDHAAIKAYAEKLARKRAKTIAAMAELQAEAQQRGEY